MNRTVWAIVVVGIGLTIASGLSAFAEVRPVLEAGSTLESRMAALVARSMQPGPSYRSKLRVLNDCNAVLNSMPAATLPQAERRALLEHCGAMAGNVTAGSPTFSLGWYVQALVAEGQGDAVARDAGLVKSQMTAPNQGWLALSRAFVAARHADTLDAEASAGFDLDLAVLVGSERGVAWMAQRYVGDPVLGARIAGVVETLSEAEQRRFVGQVRRFSAPQ